jgi:glycosyltransferase involved in cell wall biosynthesis
MNKWIICNGPDWFRPSVTSTRQIIYQFRKNDYNVLWVNPIAFKSPAVNSDNKKSIHKKVVNKLKTHLKFFRKVEKGFYVLVPFYIPLFSPFWDKINASFIRFQLKMASSLLDFKMKDAILWISGSFTLSPLLKKTFQTKVYQAADLISDFRTTNQHLLAELKKKEFYLSQNVDYLFASSPNIQSKLEKLSGREVHLLTHGVDFDHFTNNHKIHPTIVNIRDQGKPIAGYFGTLSDANDKEVFRKLAQNGFSVVIIGKVLGDYSTLKNQENIYFTGPVAYDELPSYAQGFDVCLLNWIMADWIKNSFPIKTLEYLAMGKPIVSCRIPVVEQMFDELVYFAETPDDFLTQSRLAVENDSPVLAQMRIKMASQQTWEQKYHNIARTIGS